MAELMRILWHGIGPWHKTGYGVQTALFVPRLAALGHELVIAHMGIRGRDDDPRKCHPGAVQAVTTGSWEGFPVIGPGLTEFALPRPMVIREAFGGHNPDLVLVLKDPFVLTASDYRPWNTAVWVNIDCAPMGAPDAAFFRASGARPVAVSKHGLSMLRKAGFKNALYVPHGIDQAVWQPGDRAAARDLLGLPQDAYIAGINATNIGPRKAWGEQFAAFAAFRRMQPGRECLLLVHTVPEHPEGINLRELAFELGLVADPVNPLPDDAVKFGSHVNMRDAQLVTWYQAIDDLLACSYGEGFGMPIAEALACATPVIGTDCSAISEKIPPGCGYLVTAQQWWNPHHRAWWHIPRIGEITAKMGRQQYPVPVDYRDRYDADMITREHWKPALEELLS